ncbi:hypothetical protein TrLO_g8629 [Triparma laevis f. longispina]|uniref:Peptidase S9 prolyl oligopeptidase catalytic domain-containing protein n=1 Tax=Triparma laevis f. longispina TaxID=1714387 RepID=A0A9W7EF49_9STRA|nr:hypothetical protein TrLO_g8629 [Triparma laevis f. longispina]
MPKLPSSLLSSSSISLSSPFPTTPIRYLLTSDGKTTLSGSPSSTCPDLRSTVHEYGGTPCQLSQNLCIGQSYESGIVYETEAGEWEKGVEGKYGDFNMSGDDVLCVRERVVDGQVLNDIVKITGDKYDTCEVIASGIDFYSYPSSFSGLTAWVEWDHPNMPWDDTRVVMLSEEGQKKVLEKEGSSGQVRIREGEVWYVSDAGGEYYNLRGYVNGKKKTISVPDEDFSVGGFGWSGGVRSWGFLSPTLAAVKSKNVKTGLTSILILNLTTSEVVKRLESDVTLCDSISSLCTRGDDVIYTGGGFSSPEGVYVIEGEGGWETATQEVRSLPEDNEILTDYAPSFTSPKHIETSNGVHAYLYHPGISKPPLLMKCHGGPTSSTSLTFRLDIQYWLTRGYAVVDVDYSGSSGYGKTYRERLKGAWGVRDRDDCFDVVEYLVGEGLVDPDKVAIDGGSAGGYTTLCCLTFQPKSIFKAGCSKYGISDLTSLYESTHKFESRYMDGLIGKYPEDEKIYFERCPLKYVEKLSCPVLLLQGAEDKVVTPDQSQMMFDSLKEKGVKTSLVMYAGEQHGFRKKENIKHALDAEEDFFAEVFGLESGGEAGLKMGECLER